MILKQTGGKQWILVRQSVKMAPQLYITVYKEHFTSPGRVTREQLRPTSANRKNNPQPRPDFLFPRSLKSSHSSRPTLPHPLPPVDKGRSLFPPVKHLSFHSPVMTFPDNYINRVGAGKSIHMPPVNPSTVPSLPSADKLQKSQLTASPAGPGFNLYAALKNPARTDYQRNVYPLSAQPLRQHAVTQLRTRPQTGTPQNHFTRTQFRSTSNSTLYNSGCDSCFHVVKSYQAGDYIIHPEFVSECFR